MGSEIVISMTGDEAKALAAIKRLDDGTGDYEKTLKKLNASAKDLDDTQTKMGRDAQRVWDQTRTSAERYNAAVDKTNKLHASGAIDAATHRRELARLTDNYSSAVDKAESAASQFGQAGIKVSGGVATAAVVAAVAIREIGRAWAETERQITESAARLASEKNPLGALGQVGDKAERDRLVKAADTYFQSGAAGSREQALRTVFSIKSAGMERDMPFFQAAASSGLIDDPATQARAIGTLQSTLGKEAVGDVRSISSKLLAAAANAPTTSQGLAEAAARGGASARALGLKPDEVLAATAQLITSTGQAERGGTMGQTLYSQLLKMQAGGGENGEPAVNFSGMSFRQMIETVAKMHIPDAELATRIGGDEAASAFRILSGNLPAYDSTLASIQAAPGQDLVGRRIAENLADPNIHWARNLQAERAKAAMASDAAGLERMKSDAFLARREQEMAGDGLPGTLRNLSLRAGRVARGVVGDSVFNWFYDVDKTFGQPAALAPAMPAPAPMLPPPPTQAAPRSISQPGPVPAGMVFGEGRLPNGAFGNVFEPEPEWARRLNEAAQSMKEAATTLQRSAQGRPMMDGGQRDSER